MLPEQIPVHVHKTEPHRRHFVTEEDVRTVLGRLPEDLWRRLRAVHLTDRARGSRVYGYVQPGHREISLCAMPPRFGLGKIARLSGGPEVFGALPASQSPVLAVRRFMLYDVLLHELGHLQEDPGAERSRKLRFLGETKAQDFANHWRAELWSKPFESNDPVHWPPSPEEMAALRAGWIESNLAFKRGWELDGQEEHSKALPCYARAIELYPQHSYALERLGIRIYEDRSKRPETRVSGAIDLLEKALRLDPGLPDAWLFLAMALSYVNRHPESEAAFRRAERLDPLRYFACACHAKTLGRWGRTDEALLCFSNLSRRAPNDATVLLFHGRFLVDLADAGEDRHLAKAIQLLERAVKVDPDDADCHCQLARAYLLTPDRASDSRSHLLEALRIEPGHKLSLRLL